MSRPNTPKSFWRIVDRSGGARACWPWLGYTDPKGYGGLFYQKKRSRAHRIAYLITKGKIPEGMHVLHRCDMRNCCNPRHLFIGTQSDNNVDAAKKGRQFKRLPYEKVLLIQQLYQRPQGRDWNNVMHSPRRWTQLALAKRFGVSRPLVCMIVNSQVRNHGT